jgi:hypothetical protein
VDIISLKYNLFWPWYCWTIARLNVSSIQWLFVDVDRNLEIAEDIIDEMILNAVKSQTSRADNVLSVFQCLSFNLKLMFCKWKLSLLVRLYICIFKNWDLLEMWNSYMYLFIYSKTIFHNNNHISIRKLFTCPGQPFLVLSNFLVSYRDEKIKQYLWWN